MLGEGCCSAFADVPDAKRVDEPVERRGLAGLNSLVSVLGGFSAMRSSGTI